VSSDQIAESKLPAHVVKDAVDRVNEKLREDLEDKFVFTNQLKTLRALFNARTAVDNDSNDAETVVVGCDFEDLVCSVW